MVTRSHQDSASIPGEDFLHLVWLLKTGHQVSIQDVEDALEVLPEVGFQERSKAARLDELLRESLAGNPRSFAQFEFEALQSVEFPSEWVEEELRESAWQLYGNSWQTPLYLQLFQATVYAEQDRWSEFEALLDQAYATVEGEWKRYSATYISGREVTRENSIGHRLLKEAVETWSRAIDEIVDAAESQQTWESALETAEYASRLSTMSHLYAQRIKESTQGRGGQQ